MGKSTSAQMLGRDHGYVYYEADCFTRLCNPYVPLNVDNPSLAQVRIFVQIECEIFSSLNSDPPEDPEGSRGRGEEGLD